MIDEVRAETNESSHNRLPIKVRSVRKAPLDADTQETIRSGTELVLNRRRRTTFVSTLPDIANPRENAEVGVHRGDG